MGGKSSISTTNPSPFWSIFGIHIWQETFEARTKGGFVQDLRDEQSHRLPKNEDFKNPWIGKKGGKHGKQLMNNYSFMD